MRRVSTVLTCLFIAVLLSVSAAARSAAETTSMPQDPLITYLETIVVPAIKGRPLSDETLKAFYTEGLLPGTHVQVAEDQFAQYWKNAAKSHTPGAIYTADVRYTLAEPVFNDANDEADIKSDMTVTMSQNPAMTFLAILVVTVCAASGEYCPPMAIGGKRETTTAGTYHLVKLHGKWRLDLPAKVVSEMRTLPTAHAATRYAPNASAADGGLTLWASDVALERDGTTVHLTVENGTDGELSLFTAAALATLTDEHGKTYGVRALRTFYPDHVSPQDSAEGDLVFEPVPPGTSKLLLAFPNVSVADRVLTVTLEITLAPERSRVPGRAGDPDMLMFVDNDGQAHF
jgi:hypothetical protein